MSILSTHITQPFNAFISEPSSWPDDPEQHPATLAI